MDTRNSILDTRRSERAGQASSLMGYRATYTDGTVEEFLFRSEEGAAYFKQMEGDHLVTWERIDLD
jgi:hypothetical protein